MDWEQILLNMFGEQEKQPDPLMSLLSYGVLNSFLNPNPQLPPQFINQYLPQKGAAGVTSNMQQWVPLAQLYAKKHNVPAHIVLGIIEQESSGNPNIKNTTTTAGGLGQFIDATAKGLNISNKYDPEQAIEGIARNLSMNMQRFGNINQAVAAHYAGGPGPYWQHGTGTYAPSVLQKASKYQLPQMPQSAPVSGIPTVPPEVPSPITLGYTLASLGGLRRLLFQNP